MGFQVLVARLAAVSIALDGFAKASLIAANTLIALLDLHLVAVYICAGLAKPQPATVRRRSGAER